MSIPIYHPTEAEDQMTAAAIIGVEIGIEVIGIEVIGTGATEAIGVIVEIGDMIGVTMAEGLAVEVEVEVASNGEAPVGIATGKNLSTISIADNAPCTVA